MGNSGHRECTVKYMLLMNYYIEGVPPIDQWAPEDVRRHIQFQHDLGAELVASGEFVDGQGLAWPDAAKLVRSDGLSAPVVTDGPFAESKEFLAGYWTVDVEDEARAIEIAAKASSAPGPDGVPIQQVMQVRAVMEAPAPAE
ncbi:hypothetical protein ASG23_13505 [Cellulomonas sp. Leaf395]|nr:hypothetical protein ASG23_13505 [Cellulomonas sp. Leaf395]